MIILRPLWWYFTQRPVTEWLNTEGTTVMWWPVSLTPCLLFPVVYFRLKDRGISTNMPALTMSAYFPEAYLHNGVLYLISDKFLFFLRRGPMPGLLLTVNWGAMVLCVWSSCSASRVPGSQTWTIILSFRQYRRLNTDFVHMGKAIS